MYKQISTSAESKIIGVTNGVYQLEIDEKSIILESNNANLDIDAILNQVNVFEFLDNQDYIFDLKISTIKASLLKKAKLTDVMGYSPFYFGFKFVVSAKFVECLKKANVKTSEYCLFELNIKNVDEQYFFFFVPMIPSSEIIYNKSRIFLEKDLLEENKKAIDINSFGDYQEFTMKNPFIYFEEINIKNEYSKRDIISIQSTTQLFFSQRLIDIFKANNVSNFFESGRQVKLSFS